MHTRRIIKLIIITYTPTRFILFFTNTLSLSYDVGCAGDRSVAAAVEHSERERGSEACATTAASGAGARGAARARAGGPHACWRRSHRQHTARRAARAQAGHEDCCADVLL